MNQEKNTLKPKIADEYWQYLRAVCIICVILIHSKNGIGYENNLSVSWNYNYWIVMRQIINFPVATFSFYQAIL